MNEHKTDILGRLHTVTLEKLLNDSHEQLKCISESETVVTTKASGLLQIVFPAFVVLFGFGVNEFINDKPNKTLLVLSLLESVVLAFGCYFLAETLKAKVFGLYGVKPTSALHDTLSNEYPETELRQYLCDRIFSIDEQLEVNQTALDERVDTYKFALWGLIYGTASVICLFLLYQCLFGFSFRNLKLFAA